MSIPIIPPCDSNGHLKNYIYLLLGVERLIIYNSNGIHLIAGANRKNEEKYNVFYKKHLTFIQYMK